jgi:superfamily II DNA or RNA helicase
MGRLSIGHSRLRQLVEQKIISLFFSTGSVNALTESLNKALNSSGIRDTIYPNRIHTLLSDDQSRALNESTVTLIERAFNTLNNDGNQVEPSSTTTFKQLVAPILIRWQASRRSEASLREIADELSLPPAVVRYILRQSGQVGNELDRNRLEHTGLIQSGSSQAKANAFRLLPDWSFQDIAVRRIVDSLASRGGKKVGLILPTGGGKTRIALRIALATLARERSSSGKVVWVTHRLNLRNQARRELHKMLSEGVPDLPDNSAKLLADRIDFIMLSDLSDRLLAPDERPLLLIVDEAHHAAALSYEAIFETPYPLPSLFLTATPNRTDDLPIGIDEIAYTTTYRDLSERGVIILPEFEDVRVDNFDWSEASVRDLADLVVSRAANEYVKTLVLAPRIDRVEEFYNALTERLEADADHPLAPDDIGFVHSKGNSRDSDTEDFLAYFADKPRGIIVSAQLLLEGFDDPAINAVVITYPSSSMIVLMQAAGRCVRYHPGKTASYVLQARNDELAYHFDQRWLYQEISDYLRPQLFDYDYSDLRGLGDKVREVLEGHHVSPAVRQKLLSELESVTPGEHCRLLISGLPYYGSRSEFDAGAPWTAVLERSGNSATFRMLFNNFCALRANVSDPVDFLERYGSPFGIRKDFSAEGDWRLYTDMLTAMYFARKEVYEDGSRSTLGEGRPYKQHGPTTWLKYFTFNYRPSVPPEFGAFLEDCYNSDLLIAAYLNNTKGYPLCVKIPLPLQGCEGYLFDDAQARSFQSLVESTRSALKDVPPVEQFSLLAAHLMRVGHANQPLSLLTRIERVLPEEGYAQYVFDLERESIQASALDRSIYLKDEKEVYNASDEGVQ